MDRLLAIEGQNIVETMVPFSILKKIWNDRLTVYNTKQKKRWNNREICHLTKELKQRIDYLQCKAKKLLKQRLDFHLINFVQ